MSVPIRDMAILSRRKCPASTYGLTVVSFQFLIMLACSQALGNVPRYIQYNETTLDIMCSGDRKTPTVFFIGGEKTGSTAMYNQVRKSIPYLGPGVTLVDESVESKWNVKEKFFWGEIGRAPSKYIQGKDAKNIYLRHYARCLDMRSSADPSGTWNVRAIPKDNVRGEMFHIAADFTASLLVDPDSPSYIQEAYGETMSKRLKFVVILRSCPEETYRSLIYMQLRNTQMEETTENALNRVHQNEQHLARCCDEYTAGPEKYIECISNAKVTEFAHGAYAPLLRHWFKSFNPSQFIVIQSEYFFSHTEDAMAELGSSLSLPVIPSQIVVGSTKFNNKNFKKPKSSKDAEVLRQMKEIYKPLRKGMLEFLEEHTAADAPADKKIKFIGNMQDFRDAANSPSYLNL